jgi:hypothetical protein
MQDFAGIGENSGLDWQGREKEPVLSARFLQAIALPPRRGKVFGWRRIRFGARFI